jgi:hypothetical protein
MSVLKMMRVRKCKMKSKTNRFLSSAVVLFILAVPVLSHHGTGISYDSSKMFQMTGTVFCGFVLGIQQAYLSAPQIPDPRTPDRYGRPMDA